MQLWVPLWMIKSQNSTQQWIKARFQSWWWWIYSKILPPLPSDLLREEIHRKPHPLNILKEKALIFQWGNNRDTNRDYLRVKLISKEKKTYRQLLLTLSLLVMREKFTNKISQRTCFLKNKLISTGYLQHIGKWFLKQSCKLH